MKYKNNKPKWVPPWLKEFEQNPETERFTKAQRRDVMLLRKNGYSYEAAIKEVTRQATDDE